MMDSLLERFCRYVRIDTQADEKSRSYPSSPGQLELGRILADELRALGAAEVEHTEHGLVFATIPATLPHTGPTIAWIAHVDTSPETVGRNVRPLVHRGYDGRDIVLPGDPTKVLRVADNPELVVQTGKTIITTDGTTLLGSDDKSGVAVIMEAARRLLANRHLPHGRVRICFTCDEEIGRGVDHIDLGRLGAHVGYTLDGGGQGEIDVETFSADLAVVTLTGINCHPSEAKGKMVNAVRLVGRFLEAMPQRELSPETTAGREGFLHPYRVEGGVGEVICRILLRDFDTSRLAEKADILRRVAASIENQSPGLKCRIEVSKQYRNMADGLGREPRAVALAEAAMRRVGLEPRRTIVRGGTDGSRLTEMGLPTPNLSTGEHNLHSPLEWTCLEEMEMAVSVLLELAEIWGKETA